MADSDLSGDLNPLGTNGDDGPDDLNVDEILEAIIEEAANHEDSDEGLTEHVQCKSLEKLPPKMYDTF